MEWKIYLGFWKSNKQNGLGKFKDSNSNEYKFGIWVEGKRTQWINEEELKNESNKYFKEYQQILKFYANFSKDNFDEKKLF